MPDQQIPPKHDDGPKGPPPPQMHEVMELKERVARLEGMIEVLMHSKHGHCECPECKKGE